MDDILVFGKENKEHDKRLNWVLQHLQQKSVTLNWEKCEFRKRSIKFLGHIIDKEGLRADPDKTAAIVKMEPLKSVSELRRFLGMANQLGNFLPSLADLTKPLRKLLSSKVAWTWGPKQDEAFRDVKKELAKSTVLAMYNPIAETKVSADSSSYGLGAVLFQKAGEVWKPVVYAS